MAKNGNNPAVEIEGDDFRWSFTQEGLQAVLDTVRAMWADTLIWASANPLLFIIVLVFLVVIIRLYFRYRLERRRQKDDYNRWRDRLRRKRQPSLPLLEEPDSSDQGSNDQRSKGKT